MIDPMELRKVIRQYEFLITKRLSPDDVLLQLSATSMRRTTSPFEVGDVVTLNPELDENDYNYIMPTGAQPAIIIANIPTLTNDVDAPISTWDDVLLLSISTKVPESASRHLFVKPDKLPQNESEAEVIGEDVFRKIRSESSIYPRIITTNSAYFVKVGHTNLFLED